MATNLTSDGARAILGTRQQVPILDSYMSYLDTAALGSPADHTVLFFHGNPTAAYLWRNIIPYVQPLARCLAPDLIGQGHSGQEPNNQYSFNDQYKVGLGCCLVILLISVKLNYLFYTILHQY